MGNNFLELEQVNTVLAVQRNVVLGGRKGWLMRYYYDPINRNSDRLRRILGGNRLTADDLANLLIQTMLNDSDDKDSSKASVHEGVVCHGCKVQNIDGTRYMCAQCEKL